MAWSYSDWNNRTTYSTLLARRNRLIAHMEEVADKIRVSTISGDLSVNSAQVQAYYGDLTKKLAELDALVGDTLDSSSTTVSGRFIRGVPR